MTCDEVMATLSDAARALVTCADSGVAALSVSTVFNSLPPAALVVDLGQGTIKNTDNSTGDVVIDSHGTTWNRDTGVITEAVPVPAYLKTTSDPEPAHEPLITASVAHVYSAALVVLLAVAYLAGRRSVR